LTPELLPDFLAFFEGPAFADNPAWHSCYCQFLCVDHWKVNWPERGAEQNRSQAFERICSNRMQGYLAYLDGRPVGWCSAAPRPMMHAFDDEPDPDAARIGQIGCFVIAKPRRRIGIARMLLDAACEGFRTQGLAFAEATPKSDATSDAQNHFGPLRMYLDAGFSVHRAQADDVIRVRRAL
jgi:GNAT superfamily N-acetyltransferase